MSYPNKKIEDKTEEVKVTETVKSVEAVKPTPAQEALLFAERTKKLLDAESKVKVLLPLGPNEKKSEASEIFGTNGYMQKFPKGEYIDVPKSIGDRIMEIQNANASVGEDMKVNRDKKVEEALS